MNPTIITVAPTGTLSPKASNPNVPVTPKEIAEDVYQCWKAGAAIAHLHMRDKDDHGTMDKELFKETVQRIRDYCDNQLIFKESAYVYYVCTDAY